MIDNDIEAVTGKPDHRIRIRDLFYWIILPIGNDNRNASKSRIIRGGAWDKSDYVLRSAARGMFNPYEKSNNIGFRCAR